MPKSKTDGFRIELAHELLQHLPGEWVLEEAHASTHLKKHYSWGYAAVYPSANFKFAPIANVQLTYGIFHTCLAPIFDQLSRANGFEVLDFVQFYQDTLNRPLDSGAKYATAIDYKQADCVALIRQLLNLPGTSSTQDLSSYIMRFSDLHEIRTALEQRDGSFLGGGREEDIVVIDHYLNDLNHLRAYRSRCSIPESRLVDNALSTLGVNL